MSEMGFENVFYLENFECAGDEVLVESSPPPSPGMAASLAAPTQGNGAGNTSPSAVRELIVIPEIPNSIQLQHAMQQVSNTLVEVKGDSSGQSSPSVDAQHTYITVARSWTGRYPEATVKAEEHSDESEGGNGTNYHVQYVTEPQEIYTQGNQTHMEELRTYPVYGVATVANPAPAEGTSFDSNWGGASSAEYSAYGIVVAGDEAEAPSSPATPGAPRMPPATVQWLLDHYETADGVSLPRSSLYAHYLRHCTSHRLEPVNAASFGKLIRSVFVGLRTRRLGTRGNSKYHYYGIRAKPHAAADTSADTAAADKTDLYDAQEGRARSSERETASSPVGISGVAHRQYLGTVTAPDPPELLLDELPDDVPPSALPALRKHHREHGSSFLEAVAALDTSGVERTRRSFWRGAAGGDAGALCRRTLLALAARRDVARWLRSADLLLYQRAVDLLLPDVLRPIPPQLTQAIRNFAKTLESALAGASNGAPPAASRAQAAAAAALAAALRRYTSLNHLAQAARAVLTNHHQIHQMVLDLNRVDFRVVREQAAWACACAAAPHALRLETDFKATLCRGASLEQWAAWLEGCVGAALLPHEARPGYTRRARRLLLHWSFYSSLVIRELTLRSAASFGSFHLLRLLYDEYVSYLVERRVAAHRAAPPIAVMQRALDDDDDVAEDNSRGDGDDDNPDWEWDDEDEEDDEPLDNKKHKLND
ncbi:DNA-binding protein RFX2 isoform X3 [Bombyx mandarina]|uniref:RFX-type winged-helix domain-containing protein n=2 Tax=Bombyx TaxID=7090 RepID=A0A8R2R4I7_BOMMO|nr:DNA-binding protein RFX2 isoform X3 [Bombyx mandarina]XP_037874779.1 DNA-binding protein RFX2 isoform X3 [Bombyx mori]